MTWALEDAPVENGTEALVLMALADYAGNDGRGAYPSVGRVAYLARISDRQAQRVLENLRARNLIRYGDQQFVQHVRLDRRPKVYDLNLSMVRSPYVSSRGDVDVTPKPIVESSTESERGDIYPPNGVTPMSPDPTTEPKKGDAGNEVTSVSPRTPEEQFAYLTSRQQYLDGRARREEQLLSLADTSDTLARFWESWTEEQRDAWVERRLEQTDPPEVQRIRAVLHDKATRQEQLTSIRDGIRGGQS